MRIKELHLTNIGPFNDAHLEFAADDAPRVTIITGENGTGKTIVLDAIRQLFGVHFMRSDRKIYRSPDPIISSARMLAEFTDADDQKKSEEFRNFGVDTTFHDFSIEPSDSQDDLMHFPWRIQNGSMKAVKWVVDYWRTGLASDSFSIQSGFVPPNNSDYLFESLQGAYKNAEITNLFCYFDYLRGSDDAKEKATGKKLYETLKIICSSSLLEGGKLVRINRTSFDPIFEQNGQQVSFSSLSSGNLYMIQRLVSLLGKMYAVHILRQTPPETLCETPGLLLIDEVENHLHPKWQKRFIPTILKIFPNLQIIATTHSPFIVSSVEDAKVYVCKPHTDHCTIEDETDYYANKPVEEILASPVFGTSPFSEEISELLEQRREAIESNDEQKRKETETALKAQNPQYFSYFDIDEVLHSIAAATP